MLLRNASQVAPSPVTLPGAKDVTMRLMVGRADGAPTFSMRFFEVAPGGHTPRHSHNYEHEVMILEGSAQVYDNGQTHTAKAGDVLLVPAKAEHQFTNTGSSPLKFMCLVPVSFDCGNGQCQPTPGS
jgi:quercetin dioxygenase-like cupin family protein